MFEASVSDNLRYRRSGWSWMGLVVEAGLVSGMMLVPFWRTEIVSVVAPRAVLYVAPRPLGPAEGRLPPAAAATAVGVNLPVAARPAVRLFHAPASIPPVVNLIDPAGYAPPAFGSGPGDGQADGVALPGTVMVSIGGVPTAPPPRAAESIQAEAPRRVRVGGEVQGANLLHRVNPVYPPLAKGARIQGLVKLEGVIAKDGTIQQLRLLSGHPLLAPAALAAVQQWRYRPTHLNGEPVEVVAPIDVHFVLSP